MTETSPAPQDTRRRNLLVAGLGTAAALAGAGLALWRHSPADRSADLLWGQSFDTPTGGTLALQTLRGRPLLVNFWATWCPPCVEEMPLLDGFFRQNSSKNWQVVGLAIDQPSAVRGFLQRTPVSYPVGLAGLGGSELSKALGNDSGGLPFTVVLDSQGGVLARKIGRISPDELGRWVQGRA
ncbi:MULTISPECIES: TlpA disulfide reductase family protein [Ramlibacter]|uniref:TlpA family protein disulfide reductase n=1 Tax=Ramlibacter aquaticus TaxID=2780094 RepID=A0ABR9SK07_9BURK|nr:MULTISPECIES: TlpA disulfide reductase family protein [Ramlibacter]MBE7942688.1 TlpA family protein disulfide reductase [Ramlibacter aquaticus]